MNLVDTGIHLILLILSLGIHECAHAWAAFRFGDPTARDLGRMTLNPIPHIDIFGLIPIIMGLPIGWAKPVPVNPMRVRNPSIALPLIAAAGPISNILQMMVGCLLWVGLAMGFQLNPYGAEAAVFDVLRFYIYVNLILALFNLIPLYPLDGGKVISLLMPDRTADRYEAAMERLGFFPLFGLIVANIALGGILFSFWFGLWGPAFDWFFVLTQVPLRLG